MKNKPVFFLDSGIGGIPYCRVFLERNPHETVCYLADREHFPYGPRSREEITSLLIKLTEKIIKVVNPKIAVLACNTASISGLAVLRKTFPHLPFVGTVPAIKPATEAGRSGIVGILGTERTIEDIRSLNPKNGGCEIFGIAAPELVEFVEQQFGYAGENEKSEIVKKYIEPFRAEGIDTLVLGCTHFLCLIDEFRQEAGSGIKIFDSLEGISKRIEFLLNENEGRLRTEKTSSANLPGEQKHRFILTGEGKPESFWQNRAKTLGFDLCLLNDFPAPASGAL